MPFFSKPQYTTVTPPRKKDIPKDLYTRCPVTGDIIYTRELEKNLFVAPRSGHHFPIDSLSRIAGMVDEGSFQEFDEGLTSLDPLGFKDLVPYTERIEKAKRKTGLNDAVVCGIGRIEGIEVSLAVMDFRFNGGSMGSVVGEKITRAIERATEREIPLIIVSASGGARMQEGIYSLMQMAKTSAALGYFARTGKPYISILTNPTTGGVTASFAALGDIIIAEPAALICFAGPRVIKEGTKQELPEGFQTSEFLLERGLVDQIVPRTEMRERLSLFISAFTGVRRNAAASGQK